MRRAWAHALVLLALGGCSSSPTDESRTDEQSVKKTLSAMAVEVSDVSEEGGTRLLNPLSIMTGELRDDWVYHLNFDFDLKTGDHGNMTMDMQFTDHGRGIPVPTALADDPILNLAAVFAGTFKGEPTQLNATMVLRNPAYRAVALTGGGTLLFSDLQATFDTQDLGIDFKVSPLPFGTVTFQLSQPDFGNWTGSATFQATPVVHVVATNGVRTFDLSIDLLTGDIS